MAPRRLHTAALAVALTLVSLATPRAEANGVVTGNTFSLEMIDFPDRLVVGHSMSATVAIHVDETGSDERVSAQIQTWTETPFGRAYLSSRTRRLRPGQTTSVPVALTVNSIRPVDFAPFVATFGVSVTIKNETLEATHDLLVVPYPAR